MVLKKSVDESRGCAVSREVDERFMREALADARAAAELGEVPIGAVVVYGGEIIARAHNRRELDEDPSAHAEFLAMLEAARVLGRWRLTGCTVYVTLEPCAMCAGLMVNARIDRCVYGAADSKGGALGTLYDLSSDGRLNHEFAVTSGVLADEGARELRSFFRRLRGSDEAAAEMGEDEVSESPRAAVSFEAGGGRGDAPHVVLAVDSFKGSATSAQVETWLAEGMRRVDPSVRITAIPIADGGEGTVEALHASLGGEFRSVRVTGPLGESRDAAYLFVSGPGEAYAVIEMAQAAGIGFSPRTHEAASAAGTWGVGELMVDAMASGAKTLYVGLGGSATTDGGIGMLRALGASVLDASRAQVPSGLNGLRDAVSIDLAPARSKLEGIRLVALSDVKSPLVGPRGTVRVYGPQKGLGTGADVQDLEGLLATCDSWMAAYGARLTAARDALDGTSLQVGVEGARPKSLAGVPGSGAAGGLGAAFLALGAELAPGIDAVLDLGAFDRSVLDADLVVTGEGAIDAQTAEGKAPVGVARRAKRLRPDVPVIAVCGERADDLAAVYETGIDAALPVERGPQGISEALSPECTRLNLIATGETAMRMLRACSRRR